MKKPLAILLAFFIVFAPVYSNAVLPALAASAASATRVLVGATIKKVSPAALSNAKKAAVGICAKNPRLCGGAGMGALGLALTSDGWNIEITNNDVNNIDVDIYKIPQNGTCEIVVLFGSPPEKPLTSISADYERLMKSRRNGDSKYPYEATSAGTAEYKKMTDRIKQEASKQLNSEYTLFSHLIVPFIEYDTYYTVPKSQVVHGSTSAYYACLPYPVHKIYMNNNDLDYYITNNTTNNDIDIKDIYNFDYSQYNVNIAGNTYNGTTINNDLSKSDPSEADKKVSPDLKNKLDDKTISLDDVNDQNCTKNEAGEYDKCGDNTDPTDPTDPEEPTDPEPEPPPIECSANGFYQKICDWMDWTKQGHSSPPNTEVDVTDKTSEIVIDDSRISFDDQCPTPKDIDITVVGHTFSDALDYQPLCDFFIKLKPFVIGMGGISSALIIAGGARRG